MPLQSSGAISLADMHNFFGLGYSFASYRGRGSAPGSGPMSFSQLYGAVKLVREPPSGEYYSAGAYDWAVLSSLGGQASVYFNGLLASPVGGSSFSYGAATYYQGSYQGRTTQNTGGQNGQAITTDHYGIYRTYLG